MAFLEENAELAWKRAVINADDEQILVFEDTLMTKYALYAEKGIKMAEEQGFHEKLIILFDELNKYAQAREKESPIIEQVQYINERDRFLDVILLGVEQFMSAVNERVVVNCSTMIINRTRTAELSSPIYRFSDLQLNRIWQDCKRLHLS